MARLSRVSSNKRKKKCATKSLLMSRMASRNIIKKTEDEMLLGNLFISVNDNGEIEDLNSNYDINICRVTVGNAVQIKYSTGSISFNGTDSNMNIKDNDKVAIGIEDFSLDWWECPKPLPKPNYDFMPALQCVMYKNSIDRKKTLNHTE